MSRSATAIDPATRLARAVGYVINPFAVPAVLLAVVARHVGAGVGEAAFVGGVALAGFGLVPLAYVAFLLRTGRIESVEIRDRRRRRGPLLVALGASGVTCAVLAERAAPGSGVVAALAVLHLVNTAAILVVTLRWKISIHTATVAGAALVLAFAAWGPLSGPAAPVVGPAGAAAAALAVPLVGWARVRAGVHTHAQVAAGAVAGVLLPAAELALLARAGLLA